MTSERLALYGWGCQIYLILYYRPDSSLWGAKTQPGASPM